MNPHAPGMVSFPCYLCFVLRYFGLVRCARTRIFESPQRVLSVHVTPASTISTLFLKDCGIKSVVTMIRLNAGFSCRGGDPDFWRASTPVPPR